MFTGIVEEIGTVAKIENFADAARITVTAHVAVQDVQSGDSIAVNGVCLTVVDHSENSFSADVMQQTLSMSALGELVEGSTVNLERAVTPTTRLGGHIVQGHVDATSRMISRVTSDHWDVVRFELPSSIARYVAKQGSITVQGVSLTVSNLAEDNSWFEVSLIPATLSHTTLGDLQLGSPVNLESDIVARHVERILQVKNV